MRVTCPNCEALIPSDAMNLAEMVAKCGACDSLIDLRERMSEAASPRPAPSRPLAPQPAGLSVDATGDGLVISRRWFSFSYVPLAFFCVAWDSFLVFWYAMAFTQKGPWIMVVFPVLHVAVGVGLTYSTLAGFLNRTWVRVRGSELQISHGPIPWRGGQTIAIDELEQLYCDRGDMNRQGGQSYRVHALIKGGFRRTLLNNLDESAQALFIEQQLETYLGIPDHPVHGELPR